MAWKVHVWIMYGHAIKLVQRREREGIMKIKVNDKIAVESRSIQTMTCPAGTAYWHVEYRYNGMVVHTAHTKAIWGNPDTIAMLDHEYEVSIPLATEPKGDAAKGRRIRNYGGDKFEEVISVTHRQAIIAAVDQLVD